MQNVSSGCQSGCFIGSTVLLYLSSSEKLGATEVEIKYINFEHHACHTDIRHSKAIELMERKSHRLGSCRQQLNRWVT